jgi:hypothetical protein
MFIFNDFYIIFISFYISSLKPVQFVEPRISSLPPSIHPCPKYVKPNATIYATNKDGNKMPTTKTPISLASPAMNHVPNTKHHKMFKTKSRV